MLCSFLMNALSYRFCIFLATTTIGYVSFAATSLVFGFRMARYQDGNASLISIGNVSAATCDASFANTGKIVVWVD